MTDGARRSTILFVSQVYPPDPASVGQHVAGAAAELARRGHRVLVVTSGRGYDDPGVRYPARETTDGVEVRRVPWASFGKRSLPVRVLGGLFFLAQAIVVGLRTPDLGTVVVTTSPPMGGIAALVIGWFRKVAVKYWIMDLNPDQAVALGLARQGSPAVRAFDALNRRVLARADDVVVLDRFMARRVVAKLPSVEPRITVLPPWPLDDVAAPIDHSANTFRRAHGLEGRFVVMYSGNHSPANPLTTLLRAAEVLADDEGLVFLFVGGGIGKREVQENRSPNVRSLPYQPLSGLRESLSAADLHAVTIGDTMVGIVHPCKVYGAMAVARPILLFGPAESHLADLVARDEIGWHLTHGDVDGTVAAIRRIRERSRAELEAMGRRAQAVIADRLSRARLTAELCDVIERPRIPGGAS